jgi:hypothetical protein
MAEITPFAVLGASTRSQPIAFVEAMPQKEYGRPRNSAPIAAIEPVVR